MLIILRLLHITVCNVTRIALSALIQTARMGQQLDITTTPMARATNHRVLDADLTITEDIAVAPTPGNVPLATRSALQLCTWPIAATPSRLVVHAWVVTNRAPRGSTMLVVVVSAVEPAQTVGPVAQDSIARAAQGWIRAPVSPVVLARMCPMAHV